MKNILFLCGPNGIGKTTICKEIIKQLLNSAYVDSNPCRLMNPFVLNDDIMPILGQRDRSCVPDNRYDKAFN